MKLILLAFFCLISIVDATAQEQGKQSLDKGTLLRIAIVEKIGVFEIEGLSAEQNQNYITAFMVYEAYPLDVKVEEYDGDLNYKRYRKAITNALGSRALEMDKAIKKESVSNQLLRRMQLAKLDEKTGKPLDEQPLEIDLHQVVWLCMHPDLDQKSKEYKLVPVTGKPVDAIIERLSTQFKEVSKIVLTADVANKVIEKCDPELAKQFERLRKVSDKIEATVNIIMKQDNP